MPPPRVSLCVMPYDNLLLFDRKLHEVVAPTLRCYPDSEVELLILSNAKEKWEPPGDIDWGGVNVQYHWNEGRNEQYSRGMNWFAQHAKARVIAFLCLLHCRLYDPTWLADLLVPFETDPAVGLAGSFAATNYSYTPKLGKGWGRHVQGGCFGVMVPFLTRHPYDAIHYPQKYSDIYISTIAKQTGHRLVEVPAIRSVWATCVPEPLPPGVKIVHDHS